MRIDGPGRSFAQARTRTVRRTAAASDEDRDDGLAHEVAKSAGQELPGGRKVVTPLAGVGDDYTQARPAPTPAEIRAALRLRELLLQSQEVAPRRLAPRRDN